jgi:sec-independent protein translocase protein TatB
MFDIGFSEIVVIAVVALVVLGPERLPKAARTLGHLFARLQRYVNEVKADIRREIDLDELRKLQQNVQTAAKDLETSMTSATQAMESSVRGIESELNAAAGAGNPSGAASAGSSPAATPTGPPGAENPGTAAAAAQPSAPAAQPPRAVSEDNTRQATLPGFDRG